MNLFTMISVFCVAFMISLFFIFGGIFNLTITTIIVILFTIQCYIRYKTEKLNG